MLWNSYGFDNMDLTQPRLRLQQGPVYLEALQPFVIQISAQCRKQENGTPWDTFQAAESNQVVKERPTHTATCFNSSGKRMTNPPIAAVCFL